MDQLHHHLNYWIEENRRRVVTMQKLVHDHTIIFIMFLCICCISIPAASSSELAPPPMAKPNCTTHCGGVQIPYPFGIGPHRYCYFDKWFQIDCNESTGNKPFLRLTQLEVLNIHIEGSIRVKSPVTFINCQGKQAQQAANLMGSPFEYSEIKNKFTAVSCGYLATISSVENNVVAACLSTCDDHRFNNNRRCNIGINCCQTAIPPHISVFGTNSTEIKSSKRSDCT